MACTSLTYNFTGTPDVLSMTNHIHPYLITESDLRVPGEKVPYHHGNVLENGHDPTAHLPKGGSLMIEAQQERGRHLLLDGGLCLGHPPEKERGKDHDPAAL